VRFPGIDRTSERFWDELAEAAEQQLTSWLSFSFCGALNQFHRQLTSGEDEDGVGSFVLDTAVTLIGFAPGGDIAGVVIEIARGVYEQLPLDDPVDLTIFTRQATNNAEALAKKLADHDQSLELFRLLQEGRDGEMTGQPDDAARATAQAQSSTRSPGCPRPTRSARPSPSTGSAARSTAGTWTATRERSTSASTSTRTRAGSRSSTHP
jgi:hypothetical protein